MEWSKFNPPPIVEDILSSAPEVVVAGSTEELFELALNRSRFGQFEVYYNVPGKGPVLEATVTKVKNGLAVNYPEAYMRRRDPDCLFIGDDLPTDKETYAHKFGEPFAPLRAETYTWLKKQELAAFAFRAGSLEIGYDALAIVPKNAGFFALGLALLQGILPYESLPPSFKPRAVVWGAPVFRHTHFNGKQIVVHHRSPELYEMFSYNLYPGPSAKKGVYGMLLDLGEREGWITTHCSTVQVVTPYDNAITIMHEGASGGGKSEMLEAVHREEDGRLLIGENILTGEKRHLVLPRSCELLPVTDDMALCHPQIQTGNGKLCLTDAEDAWFLRVNHIRNYGTDTILERMTAQPKKPLFFLNIDAVPGGRALIWDHIEDSPGKPCPNPRVIIPRDNFQNIVNEPVTVDIRSFGVRCPPCSREAPTFGIIGIFHLLPPALAWLWRLVSPRGHDNPSIVEMEAMGSEGVGSFWPFATGRRVIHANLLLNQFVSYPRMRHILCPNQHIGAWKVGFMPQWIAREYLARRGTARFKPDQIRPARCSLLGYTLHQLHVEGSNIPRWFLQVDTQPEVGEEAYDAGARILTDFFHQWLPGFLKEDLAPLGKQIVQCCLDGGTVEDYEAFIPSA